MLNYVNQLDPLVPNNVRQQLRELLASKDINAKPRTNQGATMKAYNETIFQGALGQLFDTIFKPIKPKRNPIVKVRRISRRPNPITGRTFSTWHWQCALCDHHLNPRETGSTHYSELCLTWADAYRRADRHARNHHRRQ